MSLHEPPLGRAEMPHVLGWHMLCSVNLRMQQERPYRCFRRIWSSLFPFGDLNPRSRERQLPVERAISAGLSLVGGTPAHANPPVADLRPFDCRSGEGSALADTHANIQELARIAREFPLKFPSTYRYGRGAGVGRGRGVGVVLGAGVAVGVGVAVAVAVAVAVGVGEGDAQGLTGQVKLNIEATMALLPS